MKKPITARRVVVTSFIVDLSDVLINVVVTLLSGSVIMLSQTLEGLADTLTSGLLLIGIERSRSRATKEYRFGQGREIFFWVLLAGVSMFAISGTLSIYIGIDRIIHPHPIANVPLSYAVLALGLVTNGYATTLSIRRLFTQNAADHPFRRLRHSSLVETKTTLVLDALGTLASLFGLISLALYSLTSNAAFDGIGALTIGAATAVFAVGLIISTKDLLVGRSVPVETETEIRNAALSVSNVKQVIDLRTMYLGSERILVNIEVYMDRGLKTDQLERRIDSIKTAIHHAVPGVQHVQVELETPHN